jgi:hypothetical protein
VRFTYEHPELGRTEQLIGFTCSCGHVHREGGPAIEVRELREIPFYCPRCGQYAGSWTPPLKPEPEPEPEHTIELTCAACGRGALLPLPITGAVHCVHCGATNAVPDSPVDPDTSDDPP